MPPVDPPNVEELKANRDIDGLIEALSFKEDAAVRTAAADALGAIGDVRAVPPLLVALKAGDPALNLPQRAAQALGRIGVPDVEPLLAMLKDSDSVVRSRGAIAVRNTKDLRAVPPLIDLLKEGHSSVRMYAAVALGSLGDRRAMEPLKAALNDQNTTVRFSVIGALGKVGDGSAVEPLIDFLGDDDAELRREAAIALGELGAPAVKPLIAAIQNNDPASVRWVRAWAKEALVKIRDPNALEPLAAALKDKDRLTRLWAATALANLGASAIEPLTAALRDSETAVRERVAESLQEIRAAGSG